MSKKKRYFTIKSKLLKYKFILDSILITIRYRQQPFFALKKEVMKEKTQLTCIKNEEAINTIYIYIYYRTAMLLKVEEDVCEA